MPKLDEAHRITLGRITPLGVERVDLQSVLGRVLAMAATASWDMPHYDSPARDGFALRTARPRAHSSDHRMLRMN